MRAFLDAILSFIGAVSLSDEEFDSIEIEDEEEYTIEVYEALLTVLYSRESVSSFADRLEAFFKAKGVDVVSPDPAKSNILIGGGACE